MIWPFRDALWGESSKNLFQRKRPGATPAILPTPTRRIPCYNFVNFAQRMSKKIVLVGGGNMGEALVAGLLHSRVWKPSQIIVCDVRHDQLAQLQLRYKVRASADNRWAVRDADIVLLAVKPQHIKHVLEEL